MKAFIYPLAIGLSVLSLSACQRNTALYEGVSHKTVKQFWQKQALCNTAQQNYIVEVNSAAISGEKSVSFSVGKPSSDQQAYLRDAQFYLNAQALAQEQNLEALYNTNNSPLQIRTGNGDLILETQLPHIPPIISVPELYPKSLITLDKNTLIKWVADPANTGFVQLKFDFNGKDPKTGAYLRKTGVVYTTDDGQFEFKKALKQFDFPDGGFILTMSRYTNIECTDSKGQMHFIMIYSNTGFGGKIQS